MAALNLIPNIGKGSVFPMIQIATGANAAKPVFATGGGFRLYSVNSSFLTNFSVTVGAIWNVQKGLDKLSLGDPVSNQTQIDNDLRYVIKPPKIYLGFQFNF